MQTLTSFSVSQTTRPPPCLMAGDEPGLGPPPSVTKAGTAGPHGSALPPVLGWGLNFPGINGLLASLLPREPQKRGSGPAASGTHGLGHPPWGEGVWGDQRLGVTPPAGAEEPGQVGACGPLASRSGINS